MLTVCLLFCGTVRVNAQEGTEKGELLYNGIRLPLDWPPRMEQDLEPMPVPYLENPDPYDTVIPGSGTKDRATQHEEEVVDLFLAGHSYTGIFWEGGKRLRIKPRKLKVEDPDGVAPYLDTKGRLIAWEWSSASSGGRRATSRRSGSRLG